MGTNIIVTHPPKKSGPITHIVVAKPTPAAKRKTLATPRFRSFGAVGSVPLFSDAPNALRRFCRVALTDLGASVVRPPKSAAANFLSARNRRPSSASSVVSGKICSPCANFFKIESGRGPLRRPSAAK